MVTYSKINCERCKQPIKSGRIEKLIMDVAHDKVTLFYCKHCFQAVLRDL